MKKHWHRYLIFIGIIILMAGFFYEVAFAGIPYQDGTPELLENYQRQSHMASSIMLTGASLLTIGLLATLFRRVGRRYFHQP